MEQQAKKHFLINFLYVLVIVGLTVIISRFLLIRMFPFLLSLIVAALSQKPAKFISQKVGVKKSLCAAILAAGIYIGVGAGLVFLIYRIIVSSAGLIDYLPKVFSKFSELIKQLEVWVLDLLPDGYKISLSSVLEDLLKNLTAFLTDIIKKTVSSAPSFLLSSVVALVASCYISKDFDGLAKFVKSISPKGIYDRFLRIKTIFTTSVLKMLRGYFILMLITFFELWLGFLILGINTPYIWAFIISLIDFLPVLGTGAVLVPWGIYLALIGNTTLAAGIAVLYIIMVIVRNFIEPKIVSQQIGINPLFTLFSMYLGLKLFGGVGLVLFPLILIVTIKYYKDEVE